MINHVFDNMPHHYHNFVRFFTQYCGSVQHKVYVHTSGDSVKDAENLSAIKALGCEAYTYSGNQQILDVIASSNGEHFIFHSLQNRRLWLAILQKRLWNRCSWVSWGADCYQYTLPGGTFKRYVAQQVQGLTSRLMERVVALNPGDARLLTRLFGRKAVDVVPYPLVGVSAGNLVERSADRELVVLLGNSAAESNNHEELLASVAHLADDNVRIVMPLNYAGPQSHASKMAALGNKMFGNKFVPLLDMLTKQEYDNLLESVDVCVFAHDRQQGLYAAYYMLLNGKKLFLKDSTSSYVNFIDYGFSVEPLSALKQQSYHELAHQNLDASRANQQIFSDNFTEAALGPKWQALFESILGRVASVTPGQER